MKCAEFQKILPEIADSGRPAEAEEHLRSCATCSGLVADLEAITRTARELAGSDEPHPRVWLAIQRAIAEEGRTELRDEAADPPAAGWFPIPAWATAPRLSAVFALLVLMAGALLYRNLNPQPAPVTPTAAVVSPAMDANDQKMLAAVQGQEPAVRDRYERNLKKVNAYIMDAQRSVKANPDDEDARESLRQAYDQKAMLYEMALSRSMQ